MKTGVLALLGLAWASPSSGARAADSYDIPDPVDTPPSPSRLYVGGGLLSQYVGRLTTKRDGDKSLAAANYLALAATGRFEVPVPNLAFSPQLLVTPLGHKGAEGHTTASILGLATRAAYTFNNLVEMSMGPGLMLYRVGGDGEKVTQRNGDSSSVFGTPSTTTTSRMFYWDVSAGLLVRKFRLDADLLVSAPFSSKRRAVTAALTASFGLL